MSIFFPNFFFAFFHFVQVFFSPLGRFFCVGMPNLRIKSLFCTFPKLIRLFRCEIGMSSTEKCLNNRSSQRIKITAKEHSIETILHKITATQLWQTRKENKGRRQSYTKTFCYQCNSDSNNNNNRGNSYKTLFFSFWWARDHKGR